MRRQCVLLTAVAHTSGSTAEPPRATQPLEEVPVFLKPSRSSRRRASFYIPRMRETVHDAEAFASSQLGSALPLFAITSNSCEYFALRLPLLKAGFKRLPLTGGNISTACNVVWGKSPRYAPRPGSLAGSRSGHILYTPPPAPAGGGTTAGLPGMAVAPLGSLTLNNPLQRFNHYPGSHRNLGCKRGMARNIQRADQAVRSATPGSAAVESLAKEMYAFSPRTWCYPEDREAMVEAFRAASPDAHFIWKPARGSCGHGILLSRGGSANADSWQRVMREIAERSTSEVGGRVFRQYVVQEYLERPLLLNGHKMDLRLYVTVTSYDPLTIYLHEEGLVRLAAEPYRTAEGGGGAESGMVIQEGTEGTRVQGATTAHPSTTPGFDARLATLPSTASGTVCEPATLTGVTTELLPGRFRHLTNYSIGRKYQTARQQQQQQQIQGPTGTLESPTDPMAALSVLMASGGGAVGAPSEGPELKWSLQKLWDHLDATAVLHSPAHSTPSAAVKESIALLITRTLLAARPNLLRAGSKAETSCDYFELYGFDVMLDEQLRPYLIEINTLPSLESSSNFDYATKCNVVSDLLNLAMIEPFARSPASLEPFTSSPLLLQPPSAAVRPYVKQVGEVGVPPLDELSPVEQRIEIEARLQDELLSARGFKRIFPPLSPSEARCHGAPAAADSPAMVQDLSAYAALRMLTHRDELALSL